MESYVIQTLLLAEDRLDRQNWLNPVVVFEHINSLDAKIVTLDGKFDVIVERYKMEVENTLFKVATRVAGRAIGFVTDWFIYHSKEFLINHAQ